MNIDKLVEVLTPFGITESNSRSVLCKGVRYPKKDFISTHFGRKNLMDYGLNDLAVKSDAEILAEVEAAIRQAIMNRRNNLVKAEELSFYTGDQVLDDYYPARDYTTNSLVLINKNTGRSSAIHPEVWLNRLDGEERRTAMATMKLCVFTYDPYDVAPLGKTVLEGHSVLKVNTYIPPAWRMKEPPKNTPTCPEKIYRIIEHLFQKNTDYVLDWLYLALTKRAETYLVLNEAKGIGKGVFCAICSMLVGRENFMMAPESLLSSSGFNAALDSKRILVFDEFTVDKNNHTKLKRYINKYQNIEKKFESDKTVETYNSFIISNNDETDMYLEPDDRRFSVPDLNTKNLTTVMSTEEITDLVNALETDEELAYQFGYYIYYRGSTREIDPFKILRGEKFHRLVHASLCEWKRFLVETLISTAEEVISWEDLRRQFVKGNKYLVFPRHATRVEDFLKNYTLNGEPMGEVFLEGRRIFVRSFLFKKRSMTDDTQYV